MQLLCRNDDLTYFLGEKKNVVVMVHANGYGFGWTGVSRVEEECHSAGAESR